MLVDVETFLLYSLVNTYTYCLIYYLKDNIGNYDAVDDAYHGGYHLNPMLMPVAIEGTLHAFGSCYVLNPEGYMFDFKKTNCEWMINDMVCELAGPDFAREFWQAFKDNYITEADIAYIKQTGANTIRLPFNYKLFTREDYMGKNDETEGFKQMDKVIDWCRKYDLHLILDMHDCPGGQTGDNIDNGHGYPWLFESEASQQLFCQIWQKIASRYKDEPVILGYELMNEPIATMFSDTVRASLNAKLEPLYKRATKAIREVDLNHIILLGGAQWNGNFEPFSDWKFDDKIMYTCTWAR